MTDLASTSLTAAQRQLLSRLQLPLWHGRQQTTATIPAGTGSATADDTVVYAYRLGDWLLLTSQQIPLPQPQWLADLQQLLATQLVAVSANSQAEFPRSRQIDFRQLDTMNALTPLQKATLWQQLQ